MNLHDERALDGDGVARDDACVHDRACLRADDALAHQELDGSFLRREGIDGGIRAIDRDRNRDNVLAHEVNLLSGGLVLLSTTLEQRD
jgi:hypothetical protein